MRGRGKSCLWWGPVDGALCELTKGKFVDLGPGVNGSYRGTTHWLLASDPSSGENSIVRVSSLGKVI